MVYAQIKELGFLSSPSVTSIMKRIATPLGLSPSPTPWMGSFLAIHSHPMPFLCIIHGTKNSMTMTATALTLQTSFFSLPYNQIQWQPLCIPTPGWDSSSQWTVPTRDMHGRIQPYLGINMCRDGHGHSIWPIIVATISYYVWWWYDWFCLISRHALPNSITSDICLGHISSSPSVPWDWFQNYIWMQRPVP